jgi:hypothetical protein
MDVCQIAAVMCGGLFGFAVVFYWRAKQIQRETLDHLRAAGLLIEG